MANIRLSKEDKYFLNRFLREFRITNGDGSTYVVPDIDLSRMVGSTESVPLTTIVNHSKSIDFTIAELMLGEELRALGKSNFEGDDYLRIRYLLGVRMLEEYEQPKPVPIMIEKSA